MNANSQPEILHKRNLAILFLISLVSIKTIIQLNLYSKGFISVSADEFSRGIRAAKWATNPKIDLLGDLKDIWLPMEKYINGLALLIYPDVYWAPRITVFLASCIFIITFFIFVFFLFDDLNVSFLASLLVVFQPWSAWLSGTPMLEMYYLSLLFIGLVFIVLWMKKQVNYFLVAAGISFLLSSTIHVQSWVYINVAIIVSVLNNFRMNTTTPLLRIIWIIGFILISNAYIIFFEIFEYTNKGAFGMFLQAHTVYSKFVYGGYYLPVWEKLLYYPRLVLENSFVTSWVLMCISLVNLKKETRIRYKWFPTQLVIFSLIVNSVMNVFSVPATAAPGRYSLYFTVLLAPYFAFGVHKLKMHSSILSWFIRIVTVTLYLSIIWWGAKIINNFPRGMSGDAIMTGRFINTQLRQIEAKDTSFKYMVELKHWDFLGVELLSKYYDKRVYDRDYDVYNRHTSSVFLQEGKVVCKFLFENKVKLVTLYDVNLQKKAIGIGCLRKIQQIGSWKVFELISESLE